MPHIDDSVRRSFPGWDDEQIEAFYNTAKIAEEESEVTRFHIASSDIGLALVACELGWDGLLAFLDASTGSHDLDGQDIFAIAHAARYWRLRDANSLHHAVFDAASEATSRKTVNARRKSLKGLVAPLESFDILLEV